MPFLYGTLRDQITEMGNSFLFDQELDAAGVNMAKIFE